MKNRPLFYPDPKATCSLSLRIISQGSFLVTFVAVSDLIGFASTHIGNVSTTPENIYRTKQRTDVGKKHQV